MLCVMFPQSLHRRCGFCVLTALYATFAMELPVVGAGLGGFGIVEGGQLEVVFPAFAGSGAWNVLMAPMGACGVGQDIELKDGGNTCKSTSWLLRPVVVIVSSGNLKAAGLTLRTRN